MPAKQKITRKLSAILSADVKGYSLLMADDEAGTVKRLNAYRDRMSDLIQSHSGRVVDAVGDNLLAEFSSAVDAVQCSVEIQRNLRQKNRTLSENTRLEFRIGINIGDVIQDSDRIYGSGVNVAARIESLAEPGGICISHNAFHHIKEKLGFGYEYLGEHKVKNIKDPVRIYKVLTDPENAGKLVGMEPKASAGKWIWPTVVATAIFLTVICYHVYQKMVGPEYEPASVENMAFDLPDKPSIAVLPFDNMSDDPEQEYFSDGLTEEIITAFSKVPEIFVIARNSTFTYKGKPVKVQQVAEDLGVRYVLEGSVRKDKDKVRITAQLIDALTGHHLWGERYDRNLEDIFVVQEEITMKILNALEIRLTDGEQALLWKKGTDNLQAYLEQLQGYHYVINLNPENNRKARQIFEQVIAQEPNYALAYRGLASTHLNDVWLGSTKSPKMSLRQAAELLKKALSIDPSQGGAYGSLGHISRAY